MPIQDREDAAEVQAGIARVFGAPPEERAAAIRQLFVEALDFNPAQGQVSLANAPAGVELPDAADRVAALEGVHVLHIALEAPAKRACHGADCVRVMSQRHRPPHRIREGVCPVDRPQRAGERVQNETRHHGSRPG